MGKNYDLTNTEIEIMEWFWQNETPFSFKQLMDYFNDAKGKGWKKQTLNTYLSNLLKMDLLVREKGNSRFQYRAACTKDEYIHRWTRKLVRDSFGDSLSQFVCAFTGGDKLSKEDAESLKKMLDEMCQQG